MSKKSRENRKRSLSQANNLPAENEVNTDEETQLVSSASWSGPLPPPSLLADYEELLPGLAERVISLAEGEANHRRDIESKITTANSNIAWRGDALKLVGQVFGLTIGLSALASGTYLAINGHEIAGTIIGGGGLIGLCSVFVVGQLKAETKKEKG